MGSFTNYTENNVLNLFFGATAFSQPANHFIGLSTTTIADGGTNITEPSGNAYARVSVANNKTTYSVSSAGSLSNAISVTFPQATGSWGTVIDFFIADASSGGNIIAYGTLSVSKNITSGDTAQFAIGALVITLD